jgi:hypothetical protein
MTARRRPANVGAMFVLDPRLLAAAVALTAMTAGCGSGQKNKDEGSTTASSSSQRTVDTAAVEQGIDSDLSTSSVKVTANCPSDVPVEVGGTFTCTATMSNGGSGKVTVTQKGANNYTYAFQSGSVQVPGSTVDSQIEQQLAAQGAPNATATCPQTIIVTVGTTVTCNVSGAQGVANGSVTFQFSSANGTVDTSSVSEAS